MLKMIRAAIAAALLLVVPTLAAAASPYGVNIPTPTQTSGYFIDGMQTATPWSAKLQAQVGLLAMPGVTSYDVITENVASFSVAGGVPDTTYGSATIKVTAPTMQVKVADHNSVQMTLRPVDASKPFVIHLVPTQWRARWDAGERLSPDLLSRLQGFGTIRAMDAMKTNGSTLTTTRPRETDASYNAGMPVEVLADIANAAGTDLIIEIPHLATDDLATEMIAAADKRLNPALHLLVEPSNEIWNTSFAQSKWASAQATAAKTTIYAVYGQMAARIAADIVKATGSATPGRVKLMLGWQFTGPQRWPAIIAGYRAAGGQLAFIDSISAALYPQGLAGTDLTTWAATSNYAAANAQLDAWATARTPLFAQHAAFAKSIGVAFDLYEASIGQLTSAAPTIKDDAVRPAVTAFNIALTHSPEGVARFGRLMDAFAAAGGRTANYYSLVGPGSQYGVYGLFATMQDSASYPATDYVRDRNAAAWARIPIKQTAGWLARR